MVMASRSTNIEKEYGVLFKWNRLRDIDRSNGLVHCQEF